jgi:hypothetical protein
MEYSLDKYSSRAGEEAVTLVEPRRPGIGDSCETYLKAQSIRRKVEIQRRRHA